MMKNIKVHDVKTKKHDKDCVLTLYTNGYVINNKPPLVSIEAEGAK